MVSCCFGVCLCIDVLMCCGVLWCVVLVYFWFVAWYVYFWLDRLQASRVLICGMRGLGVEIAKNGETNPPIYYFGQSTFGNQGFD